MATIYIDEESEYRKPNYDLEAALIYNPQGYTADDVQHVHAEVTGANDEMDWYWIIELKEPIDGHKFVMGRGGCDYTGWDCQSSMESKYADSAIAAAELAPEVEDYGSRRIRQSLLDQLAGKEPYGVYTYERQE